MAAYDYCIGECKTYYTYLSMPDDQTMDSKVSDFMDLKEDYRRRGFVLGRPTM